MKPRKRAVAYIKVGLCDDLDSLVKELEQFCRRRRIILIEAITVEASEAQPKLDKLLKAMRSKKHVDIVIAPSFIHFSSLPKFISRLAQVHSADIGIGFVKERFILHKKSPRSQVLLQFASHFIAAEQFSKSQAIRVGLKIAAIHGRKLGRQRLPENVRREAERHFAAGYSIREVVKLMQGKISRSSLWNLRRELMKRRGG